MIKRKIYKRTLNNVGKEKYSFDYYEEKNIYLYVCHQHLKKSVKEKMNAKVKFDSYSEWRNYVSGKYKEYDKHGLMEFDRYLTQRIRNVKPGRDYWEMVATILLTIFITKIFDELLDVFPVLSNLPVLLAIVAWILVAGTIITVTYIVIWQTIIPIYEDNAEENLLIDYKEIIDDMIKEKG